MFTPYFCSHACYAEYHNIVVASDLPGQTPTGYCENCGDPVDGEGESE